MFSFHHPRLLRFLTITPSIHLSFPLSSCRMPFSSRRGSSPSPHLPKISLIKSCKLFVIGKTENISPDLQSPISASTARCLICPRPLEPRAAIQWDATPSYCRSKMFLRPLISWSSKSDSPRYLLCSLGILCPDLFLESKEQSRIIKPEQVLPVQYVLVRSTSTNIQKKNWDIILPPVLEDSYHN